ncbi:MAG: type III-B CRISPR module-associated protein Cmr5 [Cyclonatronaceae bacterium]
MKQTTEQYRAKAAWQQVSSINVDDEFLSSANGAASLIQSAGLGQAVAFWLAKGGKHIYLVNFLAQWLLKDAHANEIDKRKTGKHLMEHVTQIDSTKYRHLTTEAIAYLGWVKRFAKANQENHK